MDRNCNLRSISAKCYKRHQTTVHIEIPKITLNLKCSEVFGDSISVVDNCMVLPIRIRRKQNPNMEVLYYCIIYRERETARRSETARTWHENC